MKQYQIKLIKSFIGREYELALINKITQKNEAQILILYGRRRVGKTALIERALGKRGLLKFEGLEGKGQKEQISVFLSQLSEYVQDSKIKDLNYQSWRECFKLLSSYTEQGEWTVYLEELQWMAGYSHDLIADLKFVWDNYFSKNRKLILILCGSATSFITTNVIKSKALYNRSQSILELREFSTGEAHQFLLKKHSSLEFMDIYLSVGGIPEYLNYLKDGSSLFLNLCANAFKPGSFFSNEIDRIFASHLSDRRIYRALVDFLSHRQFATREAILKHLKLESSGRLTEVVADLQECHFITKVVPFGHTERSRLARYTIEDKYLQFYYKFVAPIRSRIDAGDYKKNQTQALNLDTWRKWLGYAFERWCRSNSHLIAEKLGFAGVSYQAGAFFNRSASKKDPNYQIDLLFDRADRVMSVCEIKYTQTPVGLEVVSEFENKLSALRLKSSKTIQRVLISASGASPKLSGHFDRILTLDDLLD